MRNEVEVIEQVRSTMASVFGLDEAEIADDVSQDSFTAWSSLRHMMLMVGLEEQFDIELTMDEMLSMKSLPTIVTIVRQRPSVGM